MRNPQRYAHFLAPSQVLRRGQRATRTSRPPRRSPATPPHRLSTVRRSDAKVFVASDEEKLRERVSFSADPLEVITSAALPPAVRKGSAFPSRPLHLFYDSTRRGCASPREAQPHQKTGARGSPPERPSLSAKGRGGAAHHKQVCAPPIPVEIRGQCAGRSAAPASARSMRAGRPDGPHALEATWWR
jgi:hypothetical protein